MKQKNIKQKESREGPCYAVILEQYKSESPNENETKPFTHTRSSNITYHSHGSFLHPFHIFSKFVIFLKH